MNKTKVMVNGLPGNMASTVVKHILASDDLGLVPLSLTGPEIEQLDIEEQGLKINLIRPESRNIELDDILNHRPFISVDYTHPSAVISNAEFYCKNKLPFVIGTTGGDRKMLESIVTDSKNCAVIAPNMAKQIVAFQAMMEYAAKNFPDVFKRYKLIVKESHQEGKADTSGTAKAVVGYFNELGIPFSPEQIVMVRKPIEQIELGVPEEYLGGHGWHKYTFVSEDETVLFEFTHNINGRDIYAAGTIDAIRYLDKKVAEGAEGKIYSMIDVLKGK